MDDVVVLEWPYSSPDYFGEAIHVPLAHYTIVLENGKAVCRVPTAVYDADPEKVRDQVYRAANAAFQAARLQTREQCELSPVCTVTRGEAKTAALRSGFERKREFNAGGVVLVTSDENGERTVRIGTVGLDQDYVRLAAQYGPIDRVAKAILDSADAASKNPNSELVHLYEIMEALEKELGEGKYKAAAHALRMEPDRWSTLKRLADGEPLRQGRHGGTKAGKLRDATDAELQEGRGIAQEMIAAYLRYLESRHTSP
jgi:hypothetical protein